MLSRFYAAFATLHKTDPSRTVGIAAFVFLKKSGTFFRGAGAQGKPMTKSGNYKKNPITSKEQ